MARPRAGDWLDDEIRAWRDAGVDLVVSLLEPQEVSDLELQRERTLCEHHDIDFLSFPIPDRGVPSSLAEARALAGEIAKRGAEGAGVAIHCRAGIGRSSLMAALVLATAGMDSADAFAAITHARGMSVPDTDAQRAWVAAAIP
ncbi:protein-tyrosine phosphatase family protein [Sphingomonas oligophenolica]|uniref:Protein-tyrosine phosphatase family protein n=2 Tax=Sphingomonas oligophenolica TaxID=301154 RepID=A0ABU9Y4R6_9SPHN